MKRLKIALLTLLLPILAFADRTLTIEFKDGNGSYIALPTALTAIKGKYENWTFRAYSEEVVLKSGSWTVTGNPNWLQKTGSNIISLRGTVPTAATGFTLTLKFILQGGETEITQEISVTIVEPEIQYRYNSGGSDWSNEISISAIKGKFESYEFITSSLLPGNWEVVSGPDWLRNSIYNGGVQDAIYTYGQVPEDAPETVTLELKVTNEAGSVTKTYNIAVHTPAIPTITTNTLEAGEVGKYYRAPLITSSIYAQWSLADGSLPPGLELSSNGFIYGYPTTEGTSNFTVKSKNISGEQTEALSITIGSETTKPIFEYLPYCTVFVEEEGEEIEIQRCYVQEGTPYIGFTLDRVPTNVSIKSGNLPPGIEIKRDLSDDYYVHYLFSGSLTYKTGGEAANTYTFTVEVENSAGSSEQEFTFVVTQAEKAPKIGNIYIYEGEVDEEYSGEIWLEDDEVGAIWTVSGLPPGLTWRPEWYGISIRGIPTQVGKYNVTVKATNSRSIVPDTKSATITICKNGVCTASTPPATIDPPISSCPTGAVCGIGVSPPPATTPVISQLDVSKLSVRATSSAIVLEKLPSNAKVEVYNLQGKRIYSANSANSQTLQIQVPKGMYVVKAANQTLRAVVK